MKSEEISRQEPYKQIYESFDPIMKSAGFIRKNHRYYRVHGDKIIQTVGRLTNIGDWQEDIQLAFSHPCMGIDYKKYKDGNGATTRLGILRDPNRGFSFEWKIEQGEVKFEDLDNQRNEWRYKKKLWISRIIPQMLDVMQEKGLPYLDSIRSFDDILANLNQCEIPDLLCGEVKLTRRHMDFEASFNFCIATRNIERARVIVDGQLELMESADEATRNDPRFEPFSKYYFSLNDLLEKNSEEEYDKFVAENEEKAIESVRNYLKLDI